MIGKGMGEACGDGLQHGDRCDCCVTDPAKDKLPNHQTATPGLAPHAAGSTHALSFGGRLSRITREADKQYDH